MNGRRSVVALVSVVSAIVKEITLTSPSGRVPRASARWPGLFSTNTDSCRMLM